MNGPVQQRERAFAPDLARGAMLLFIALANATNSAFGTGPGIDPDPNGVSRVVNFGMSMFVDARAYPVFAIMFGYSMVQLARRHPRRILLRRNAWLVVFGFVHALLLYFGDFLAAYGIVGIIATLLLLDRSDKFHRLVLFIWTVMIVEVLVLGVLALSRLGEDGASAQLEVRQDDSLVATSYLDALADRMKEWPMHTVTVVPFIIIVWLGIWAARRRLLEDPAAHRVLLTRVAAGGLGVAFVGALPYALVTAGWLHASEETLDALSLLHNVSGMFGGPGYAAAIGLLCIFLKRRGPFAAVAALGQRSLSGYLFQSVCWLVAFAPYLLGLRDDSVVAVSVGAGAWIVSVLIAAELDRRDLPGPAEKVLRRLTYGPIAAGSAADRSTRTAAADQPDRDRPSPTRYAERDGDR